jgi:hypothetical protein
MGRSGLREKNKKQTEERVGEWESGRVGEWESGRKRSIQSPLSPTLPLSHSFVFLLELKSRGELPGAWAAEAESLTCLRSRLAKGFIQTSIEIG